ncbi:DUF2878 domain-containing protein [Shewanella mesophila]|uniref:DUF2878 domain-containing protein n=1 Tax=Shewanella mesophila TaxID=2864208 RepID=UPI001C656147|nr:DUF2878 domain-containing protein [Shewanella mesophila]QYJ84927.1 DUF2878 domain-containing protein [Shewanella mesophila]
MKLFWIINLLLFQLCWFSAALLPQYAAIIMAGLIAIHFGLSPTRKQDIKVLLLVPIGIAVDKLQLEVGGFESVNQGFPVWLLLLWCIFIISLNHSLKWLTERSLAVISLFGAMGGASSYWAGIQFGSFKAVWSDTWLVLSLMLVWSLLMPIFVICYRQLQLSNPVR